MQYRSLAAVLISALPLLLAGCDNSPWYTHRFRLFAEIETPSGTKTGSSVIEVAGRIVSTINGKMWSPRIFGDAVVIELDNGQSLVALLAVGQELKVYEFYRIALTAFDLPGGEPSWQKMQVQTGEADVPWRALPTLVLVENPADEKSVRLISPTALSLELGKGFTSYRARLEMTRDPISRGIEKKLPFLTDLKRRGLGNVIRTTAGIFTVNVPHFVME